MKQAAKKALTRAVPWLLPTIREFRCVVHAGYMKIAGGADAKFDCPICGYYGPFASLGSGARIIRHTLCPRCDLYERHRLQWLALMRLRDSLDYSAMSLLHFAPEPQFKVRLSRLFRTYHTADIADQEVNFVADIRSLPFADASYDMIFASHVLEHVREDDVALGEISRILKPGGVAILPVPVVSPNTVEYPEANLREFGHVRAVGRDYFDKYRLHFSSVRTFDSGDFPERYQLYTYEDRSIYPDTDSPLRGPMPGQRHPDYVPVCYR